MSPENGQVGVSLSSPVVVEFSQSLDVSTVTASNFSIAKGGVAVSGSLSMSDGVNGPKTVVRFVPNNPWSPNSSYSVYIGTGIKSASGNPLFQYSSTSFSTGIILVDSQVPSVVGVNPSDGVTSVAVNSVVSVEFSKLMNQSTVNGSTFKLLSSGVPVSGRVEKVSSTVYRFIPDTLLASNTTYQVSVDGSVKDTAENAMGSPFTSTFTTQSGMDNYQPSVVSISPVSGATVPVSASIVITFSEPMNPLTLNAKNCYLQVYVTNYGYIIIPGTIALSNNNTVATLIPAQPLFAGSTYSVYVTTSVQDVAGISIPVQFTSSFTTEISGSTTSLPTAATITINPRSIFANGQIATTVSISNINRNGTPVPNGTLIGVTASPAFVLNSVGGTISGNSVGVSPDSRFMIFATEGAEVTVFYTAPDLDQLRAGATASGVIQAASLDLDGKPVGLVAQGTATFFRINSAAMTANPTSLPADGTSLSNVEVIVKDNLGNLVPDGTRVGITAAPIFTSTTAGGMIIGGVASSKDTRLQIFTTTGGRFTFSYQAPSNKGPGYGTVQAVTVSEEDYATGLAGSVNITLK